MCVCLISFAHASAPMSEYVLRAHVSMCVCACVCVCVCVCLYDTVYLMLSAKPPFLRTHFNSRDDGSSPKWPGQDSTLSHSHTHTHTYTHTHTHTHTHVTCQRAEQSERTTPQV